MHNNIMAASLRDRPLMLATGRYAQWRSRFLRYIDTRPNGDALRKCILEGTYTPSTVVILAVAVTDNSPAVPEQTTVETIMNMSPENKAHFESEKEAIHLILTGIGDEIYSTVDACQTAHEMWEAIERNNLTIDTMQVNVQFLQQLQPEWSRFVTIVKQQHKLDEVSYHKFFDILKQYQKEINEIRVERIAKNANPLAVVATAQPYQDPNYQAPKSHKSYAPTSKASLPTRSHATTRHKGKEIAKPITPPSELVSEEDNTDEEINEQELEAHYSYMAKIQEVPTADSGTNSEPLEQTELEKYKTFNDCIVDYEKLEHKLNETLGLLAQKDIDIKEGLKLKAYKISVVKEKYDELVKQSLLTKSHYEGLVKDKTKVITDLKLKEEKDIDKMISMEKKLKFLNEIVYKQSQSIQTIHMLAPKCLTFNGRPTFANPMCLKMAQSEIPCLYEIPHDQSNPANSLVPDREETLTLERESQEKLNKDLVKPYDYTKLNSLYEIFKPPTQEYLVQLAHANEIRKKIEIVDQASVKHSKDHYRLPTAHDIEILIKTCLMPLALKTQNDSFAFVHELKQEMHADLKYVESLEKEVDKLESDKAEFSNMYDMLLQEHSSDTQVFTMKMEILLEPTSNKLLDSNKDGDGDASFQLKSDSLPHAHAQTTKTYYKHQDSRIKKSQELKDKDFQPTPEDLALGTPSSKIIAKAKASQKRMASTSGATLSHVAKRTRSVLAQSSGSTTHPSLFVGDDDESDDDDACVEILLVTPLSSAVVIPSLENEVGSSAAPTTKDSRGKGVMVDDVAAPSAGASRSRPSSGPSPLFRDVSSDAINTDFFPFFCWSLLCHLSCGRCYSELRVSSGGVGRSILADDVPLSPGWKASLSKPEWDLLPITTNNLRIVSSGLKPPSR
ncbi:hypothetical protein Tco_1041988 [Tanacetum coccineum]|uniref:Gag-Pol polyprotein n=1 Tax=Tanacetum coccineum TaxID=301880 RepID=A0ABQ5GKE1_9ASTR